MISRKHYVLLSIYVILLVELLNKEVIILSKTIEKRTTLESNNVSTDSRRGFLRGMFISVAAAGVLSPVKLKADDAAIMEEAEWGVKLGYPTNKHGFHLFYDLYICENVKNILHSKSR